jgi:hypothetical protein
MKEVRMRASRLVLFAGIAALVASPGYAQGPPIHGVTGTIATPSTIKDEYKGVKKIASTVAEGIGHLTGAGTEGGPEDVFAGLKLGTTVTVEYGATKTVVGTVTNVNRSKNQISVHYHNGRVEKLKLVEKIAETSTAPDARIVYTRDEAGTAVPHYFEALDARSSPSGS